MKTFPVLAVAAASVLALSACGSSSGGSSAAASANDRDTARLKLQECLRKQGVDAPGPGAGGSSAAGRPSAVDMRKLQQAIQGPCKQEAQGAFGNRSAEDRQEFADAMAKFSSCMRKHGVDIPTFTPGKPPSGPVRINRSDPKVKAAMQACRSVMPQRPGGGGPGGAGPAVGAGAPS